MSRDGNKQSVTTKLKREIVRKLYENPDIIELLDNPEIDPDCPDTAEWTSIFPFMKIPGTQQEVNTFIGIAAKSTACKTNDIYKQMIITISVMCPAKSMRVKGQKGSRVDIIAGDISETLNWNGTFGFSLELKDEDEGVLDSKQYYYHTLRFTAIRSNDVVNGVKQY